MSNAGRPNKKHIDCKDNADPATKRDQPSILTRFLRKNRVAVSDRVFLPYEAAQLATFAPTYQRPHTRSKLALFCLAATIMTASVVSGAVVWAVHDDGLVSTMAEVSGTDSGVSMTSQLVNDLKQEVQALKLDSLAAPSSDLSVASDDRQQLPDSSLTSQSASIQSQAVSTSVQKNESDVVKDRTKASLPLGGLPATLVAAQSSGSMVDQIGSSITARQPALIAADREANGVMPHQMKPRRDAKTAQLKNNSLTRPKFKPSFKPLEVDALLSPTVVTTSFKPAFKPRETNSSNPARPGLLADSDAINGAKDTPMLKRLWGTLVDGLAEAYRNRDTSYQLVLKADSRGGGSDDHRGGGNHGGGNDYDNHDG